jgi:hypothetical protein
MKQTERGLLSRFSNKGAPRFAIPGLYLARGGPVWHNDVNFSTSVRRFSDGKR